MARVIVVQPEIPGYRRDFFSRVYRELGSTFRVIYSADSHEAIVDEPWASAVGARHRIWGGLEWQEAVASFPLQRGDIFVIPANPRQLSSVALLVKAKLSGAKVILWGHFWSSTSLYWRFYLRMQILSAADAVLFYTDNEVDEYHGWSGKTKCRLVVGLNNGINVDAVRAVRRAYDPAKRQPALMFIGQLTDKAQLALLLEALTFEVAQTASLDIIGWGAKGPELQQLADTLYLRDRIRWHGAQSNEATIAGIANECQAFVYPGEVGLSLIHGMAYGLPAIVHQDRWQHMPEIAAFTVGETGRTFVPGDARSLADAIGAALSEPEVLQRQSEACIRRAETRFNTAEMAARFVGLIERLSLERPHS